MSNLYQVECFGDLWKICYLWCFKVVHDMSTGVYHLCVYKMCYVTNHNIKSLPTLPHVYIRTYMVCFTIILWVDTCTSVVNSITRGTATTDRDAFRKYKVLKFQEGQEVGMCSYLWSNFLCDMVEKLFSVKT